MAICQITEENYGAYTVIDVQIFDAGDGWLNPPEDFLIKNGRLLKYSGKDEHVLIPADVHTVARRAFCGSSIVSVTIPYGVRKVEDEAFLDCLQLKCIKFLEDDACERGCNSIGSRAFGVSGQSRLPFRNVFLPHSLSFIGDEVFFPSDKFRDCRLTLYPTYTMIKYCADHDLDVLSNRGNFVLPVGPELVLWVSPADAALARSKNQLLFYDEELKVAADAEYYKGCIEDAERKKKYNEESLQKCRGLIRNIEEEISRRRGFLFAKARGELQQRLLRQQEKEREARDAVAFYVNKVGQYKKKLADLGNKSEEELLAAAGLYLKSNFKRMIADYKRDRALREAERNAALSYYPTSYQTPSSALPTDHGPYGTAVNAGMPRVGSGGGMPHLGDIDLSDV